MSPRRKLAATAAGFVVATGLWAFAMADRPAVSAAAPSAEIADLPQLTFETSESRLTSRTHAIIFVSETGERIGTLDFGPPLSFSGDADGSARLFFRALAEMQVAICGER